MVELVGCVECGRFAESLSNSAIETYFKIEAERERALRARGDELRRRPRVCELGGVDQSSLSGVQRLCVEQFGDLVAGVVKGSHSDGVRETVGVFLRLREGVGRPPSVGVEDLVPGVSADFYGGKFYLTVFGRAMCPIRYAEGEGCGYVELGAGEVGGLSTLAFLGLCAGRLEPLYSALVDWAAGLYPLSVEDINLVGYDDVVDRCVRLLSCDRPELMRRHVLLAGPSGCGKSAIARRVAERCVGYVKMYVSGGGSWQEMAVDLSRLLAGCKRRVLLVADEIDEWGGSRDNGGGAYALLRLLDGAGESGGLRIIATTNRPLFIDEALCRPGRFGAPIRVREPTREQRAAIVAHYVGKHGGEADAWVVADAPGRFSGADLRAAVEDLVVFGEPVSTEGVLHRLEEMRVDREEV